MDGELLKASLGGLVRHAATALAGTLFTHGVIAESDQSVVVGLVVGAAGLAWSIYQKWRSKKTA